MPCGLSPTAVFPIPGPRIKGLGPSRVTSGAFERRFFFAELLPRPEAKDVKAALVHELTHWTGANYRLDREFGKRFRDQPIPLKSSLPKLAPRFLAQNCRSPRKREPTMRNIA